MNKFEIFLNSLAGSTVAKKLFTEYVASLNIHPDDNVLDFGCGTGNLSKHIIKYLNKGKLTCLDISRESISILKKKLKNYKNVQYVSSDLKEATNIPYEFYDIIVIHLVLHDIPENERIIYIEELNRRLRPGGHIHIREPINNNHGMPSQDIKQLMESQGLEEVQCNYVNNIFIGHMVSFVFKNRNSGGRK